MIMQNIAVLVTSKYYFNRLATIFSVIQHRHCWLTRYVGPSVRNRNGMFDWLLCLWPGITM